MNIKNLILILFSSILFCTQLYSQNPAFGWSKSVGGSSIFSSSIDTDNNGNIYVTGYFNVNADFDPGIGTSVLTSKGSYDIFILKLNSLGQFLWVVQFGNTGEDRGESITVDKEGNILITGNFKKTIDFDPGLNNVSLTAPNTSTNTFLLKLDSNANFIWVKQMGGISNCLGKSITTDLKGNVYTLGRFSGTVDFDPGIGAFNLSWNGWFDIFIQKLDKNGNFIWAKQIGGSGHEYGNSIAVDRNENVFTTGTFQSNVDFDPGTGNSYRTSGGGNDIFILKLDSNGYFKWVNQIGGIADDESFSIATDLAGNVFTTGTFKSTVDFDPGIGVSIFISNGDKDIYIQKLDNNGSLIWAKQMGSTNIDEGHSIVTDVNGDIYTCGFFEGIVDFDPGLGTFNRGSAGGKDIFIQKLKSNGNLEWIQKMGGIQDDIGDFITVDNNFNLYTTGQFSGTVDFDPTDIGIKNLTAVAWKDIFIQKLKQCPNSYFTDIQSACNSYTWLDSVTYTSSNNTAKYFLSNINGCDSIITLDLTILSLDTSINIFGTTLASNAFGASYQWVNCDNNYAPIVGDTNQFFSPTASGNYAVIVTKNACTDTSSCFNITITDIRENNFENRFNIYPNPSSGKFIIHFDGQFEVNQAIKVLDMRGKLFFEEKFIQNNQEINLSQFNQGIYLLRIGNQMKKLVLTK